MYHSLSQNRVSNLNHISLGLGLGLGLGNILIVFTDNKNEKNNNKLSTLPSYKISKQYVPQTRYLNFSLIFQHFERNIIN